MVEGMSVVLNVMLSLMSVMITHLTVVAHGGEVMYFWSVCFRGELGFPNCDDICTCVVNKQLSSSSLFLILFMLACSIM